MVNEDVILSRIEQLITATEVQTTTLNDVVRRIECLEETSMSLDQMLRGDKNYLGLVADVAVMKATIGQLRSEDKNIGNKKQSTESGPTWKWIADNYTSIAIPLILWFILDIIPNVLDAIKAAIP